MIERVTVQIEDGTLIELAGYGTVIVTQYDLQCNPMPSKTGGIHPAIATQPSCVVAGPNAIAIGLSITDGEIASADQRGLWPFGNEPLNANAAQRSVSYAFRRVITDAAVQFDL